MPAAIYMTSVQALQVVMPRGEGGHVHIVFVCICNIYMQYIFKHIYLWTRASKPMQTPHHKGYFLGEPALSYPCPLLCPPYGYIPSPQALPFMCCMKSLHAVPLACRQHRGEGLGVQISHYIIVHAHGAKCHPHPLGECCCRENNKNNKSWQTTSWDLAPESTWRLTTRGKDARKFLVYSDMAADLD